MKKITNLLNKSLYLIKNNLLPFSLGLATVFVTFGLTITLLVNFYKPSGKNSSAVITPIKNITPTVIVRKHIVKQGETLFLIAQQYYGDGNLMNKIIDANKIVNPDTIEVGTTLIIP